MAVKRVLRMGHDGPDVSEAQRRLAGDGPFGSFRPGPVDGEWGPQSAAAARRARYWLGRKRESWDGAEGETYTPTLDAQLAGREPLSADQALRRKARRARKRLGLGMPVRAAASVTAREGPPMRDYRGRMATHGAMTPVRVILHDTESHDAAGATDIEGVIGFLGRTTDRLGSHYVVDAEGIIGLGGDPTQLMYHCGGANTGSVGIEQIGFARFPLSVWMLRRRQLDSVAKLLAHLNVRYGIPLTVDPHRGVSTHAMQSALPGATTDHTDPGRGYPLRGVMRRAKRYAAEGWSE